MRVLVVHGHEYWTECLRRVRRAKRITADAVILSGHGGEAEFMDHAWPERRIPAYLDTISRTTVENVVNCKGLAHAVGATEIVVVTSWWHAHRCKRLWREAGIDVTIKPSRGGLRYVPSEIGALTREHGCSSLST